MVMATNEEQIKRPFNHDQENDSASSRWFGQRALQAIALAGMGLGIYKMKGPAGKLVHKYMERRIDTQLAKDLIKTEDSQEWLLGKDYAAHPTDFGLPELDKSMVADELVHTGFKDSSMQFQTAERLKKLEDGIIGRMTDDISFSQGALPRVSRGPIMPTIDNFNIDLKDRALYEIRSNALLEFLSHNAPLDPSDVSEITKLRIGVGKEQFRQMAEKHEAYLSMYPEYAREYRKLLVAGSRKYRRRSMEFQENNANLSKKLEESQAIKFFIGNENISDDSDIPLYARANAEARKNFSKHGVGLNIPKVDDIIKKKVSFTSSSLDGRRAVSSDSLFHITGQFDYFPLTKKIMDRIDQINNDDHLKQTTKLQGITAEIVPKGTMADADFHLQLTFSYEGQKPLKVEVPLAQWGRVPGPTPGVQHRLDRMFELPNGPRNIFDKVDSSINKDLANTTQLAMREVVKALDGAIMDQARSSPLQAVKQIQRMINNVVHQTPVAEGLLSDSIKSLIIQPSFASKKMTANHLASLEDAVTTGYNIRRLSDILSSKQGAVNIVLDFETIAADVGPQHMAMSAETQLTKAAMLVTEYKDGKSSRVFGREVVSDHGYETLKNFKISERTIDWISRDLGEDDEFYRVCKGQKKYNEFFKYWHDRVLKPAAEKYKRHNDGRSFSNNFQMAEHFGEMIYNQLENATRSGKRVFITTKNGRMFDLHLLERYAPHAWAKIVKKHRHLIDLQSIAYYQQEAFSGEDSLALGKVINRIVKRLGGKEFDLSSRLLDAVSWLEGKGYKILSTELKDYAKANEINLNSAHQSPLADTLLTQVMLLDEIQKYRSGDKSYQDLGNLQRMLVRGQKILGYNETLEEYRALETRYTVYGRVASSSLLSQGNIQNQLVSLLTPDHIFPFPDNKLSKQPYQLIKGQYNTMNKSYFERKYATDIARRREMVRNFSPSITTQGALDIKSYTMKADAMTNMASHHVYADTLLVWNPYRGKEGFLSFSDQVFDMRQFEFDKVVPLDPHSIINKPHLSNNITKILKDAHHIAKEMADKNKSMITNDIMEQATREAIAKNNKIHFKPGTMLLAQGERGLETYKAEIGGELHDIFAAEDPSGKIKMYGRIKFIADGPASKSLAQRARSMYTKSVINVDRTLSIGVAMGGPQAVGSADFIRKGQIGSMKLLAAQLTHEKFIDVINKSTGREREEAIRAYKDFQQTMNADVDSSTGTLIVKYKNISDKFKHIKSPEMRAKAQMFVGGIDFSAKSMLEHMRKAGVVWTHEDAKRYIGLFKDEAHMKQTVRDAIKAAHSNIDTMIKTKGDALYGISREIANNIKDDIQMTVTSFLLPDLDKINEGIPTIFGFHKELAALGKDSPLQFGVLAKRVEYAVYGLMRGQQAEDKDIKLHPDLLKMINVVNTSSSEDTRKLIKRNIRAAHRKQFHAAYNTVHKFRDALLSGGIASKGDLSLDDLNVLVDRIGNIDLKALDKQVAAGVDVERFVTESANLIAEAEKGTDIQSIVNNFMDDMKGLNLEEAMSRNKRFITLSAVSRLTDLAKKKDGIFSYSAKKELGGAFTFNIKNIVNHGLNISEDPDSIKRVMDFFVTLSKRPDSIVESIDETNYTVKLKKLIMHADDVADNIWNSLNPAGMEKQVGLFNHSSDLRHNSALAMKEFEEQFRRVTDKTTGKIAFDNSYLVAEEKMKQQYMKYLLDGFLLDSSSIYKQAHDLTPTGMYSTIASAETVFARAHQIRSAGNFKLLHDISPELVNWGKDEIVQASKVIDDLVKGTDISDVLVTETFFKKMKIRVGGKKISIKSAFNQTFGEKGKELYESVLRGEMKLPSFVVGHPTYQNAVDAVLDLSLKVVPDKVSTFLGMNANVMNVFTEIAGIQARDFDGDQISLALKALKNAESMMQWQKDHKEQLANIMNRPEFIKRMNRDGNKMWLGEGVDHFTPDGKQVVMGTTPEGQVVAKTVDANNTIVNELIGPISEFAMHQSIHAPGNIVAPYLQDRMDELAYVAVSKKNIGLFTNIYRKRVAQIIKAGVIKDAADKALIIGNSYIGLGKLNQDMISLAKHGSGIDELQKVASYFSSGNNRDGAEQAFNNYMFSAFNEVSISNEKKQDLINKMNESFRTVKFQEGIRGIQDQVSEWQKLELAGDDANIFSLIADEEIMHQSFSASEFSRARGGSSFSDLADTLKRKFKFNPEKTSKYLSKGAKFGAIAAAGYLALNFFRPNQISNSWNPLDAFSDLGVSSNSDYGLYGDMELNRNIPLDMVDASFSKQAYMKLKGYNQGDEKKGKAEIIKRLLQNSFSDFNTFTADFSQPSKVAYSNYTQSIGSFGNSTLNRRANLL
jgi:hypothetical protein